MLLAAITWASVEGATNALVILLGILLVLFMLLYAGAYILFAFKDPNLLRSEKYNIEKLAIERGVLGDSTQGLIDGQDQPKSISDETTDEKEQ